MTRTAGFARAHSHCGLCPRPLALRAQPALGAARTGFTLIELSVVLVIIGIILFAGIAAWSTIVAGQRITATRAEMENIKRCLINRAMYSEAFPTWERTGMNCNTPRSWFDVEHCLCGRTDAWGNAIRYISGLTATDGLGEALAISPTIPPAHYVVADPVQGQVPTELDNQSRVSAPDGTIGSVAFVLVSYGSDRVADNTSYGDLFNPDLTASGRPANRIGNFITGTPDPTMFPDFSNTRNDLFLVVTSFELAGMLRR